MGVPISSRNKALWNSPVSVSAPFCQECRKMSVSWMEWNAVVPVPVVEGRLDLVWRDGGYDGPWRLRVMGLTWSMLVESSVINNSSRTTIRFWGDDHSTAPCDGVIYRNLLQDTEAYVSVKTFLDG